MAHSSSFGSYFNFNYDYHAALMSLFRACLVIFKNKRRNKNVRSYFNVLLPPNNDITHYINGYS